MAAFMSVVINSYQTNRPRRSSTSALQLAFCHEADIVHEQRVDPGLAKSHDRVGGRADDRLAVVERRIDNDRHAGAREEAGYRLVKARIRFAAHDVEPGAAVLMHDGGDAAAPLGLDRTSKQHELVTGRMAADLEPFLRVFRHDAGSKRPEVLAVLDPLVKDVAHVRPTRVG